jgi:hypothetical protein
MTLFQRSLKSKLAKSWTHQLAFSCSWNSWIPWAGNLTLSARRAMHNGYLKQDVWGFNLFLGRKIELEQIRLE